MSEVISPLPSSHLWSHAVAERFWAKVAKGAPEECWPWTGARFHFGHGAFKLGGRPWGAHRVAWALANDQPIPDGLHVLHHCDNPPCCNPAHLYLGTLADNGHDMSVRGRASFGEQHPWAKLTAHGVWIARLRVRQGAFIKDLAPALGVSAGTLARAVRGTTWQHIADPVPVAPRRRHRRYRSAKQTA